MSNMRALFIFSAISAIFVLAASPAFAQLAWQPLPISPVATSTVITTTTVTVAPPVVTPSTANTNPNAGIAAEVQSYFADIPVMTAIATCESGPRQFAANGSPLYAGTDNEMVGIFQIDSAIHTAPAAALGFDITTVAGNLGYARYLYGAEGTDPWISSFPCWSYAASGANATTTASAATSSATTTISPTNSASPALTANLSLGEVGPQVLILQQFLNQAGFTLTTSGPGSPGNETTKFGALTYTALKDFQCTENIVCSGDEATTGYGYLNPQTRTALLAYVAAKSASTAPVVAMASSTAPASTTITSTTIVTASTTPTTTTTIVVVSPATTAIITDSDPAELTSLQSRISALVLIVQQLEAELAAR